MWHLTACKSSVSLSFLNWIKMIFYRISELMLPTLNQRYDKKPTLAAMHSPYSLSVQFRPIKNETKRTDQ